MLYDLRYLSLKSNSLDGEIVKEIGLNLGGNAFEGEFPDQLFALAALDVLNLSDNMFTGPIPNRISMLRSLSRLDLHGNQFNGSVPDALSSLDGLISLDLSNNRFSGSIRAFAGLKNLQLYLNLSNNGFSGSIPGELGGLEMVQAIELSNNNITGQIPASIKGCRNLHLLDLASNSLSGQIPDDIFSQLDLLTSLNLSNNKLEGKLPSNIAELAHLSSLDLSHNQFDGRIPEGLSNLTSLGYLNLSFNQFEGPVPSNGVFKNLNWTSLEGNSGLCGARFLEHCASNHRASKKLVFALAGVLCVLLFVLVIASIIIARRCKKRRKSSFRESELDYPIVLSLRRFTREELETATDAFSDDNIIGSSALSVVYKGSLEDGRVVVVKRLNHQQFPAESEKSFHNELKTLSQLRHKNLVRIVGYAWESMKFKALVLDYMEKGSLDPVIHGEGTESARWGLSERVKVLVSVANGLDYLHAGFDFPIVHCDLKPTNILLDRDWEAHVSDFGTARMLGVRLDDASGRSSTSAFQGTIGYLAPEFAYMGRVTTKADVFSFGVVMMEFLTKVRPTACIEKEGAPLTLQEFVRGALSEGVEGALQVVDRDLIYCTTTQLEEEKVFALLELALSCTRSAPEDRPEMKEVLSVLSKICND
ncbi:LRR receptor-like serine/threonine-protein kinase FLS2 [Acorus calamus]|uniref:non-specific serine/threonine protein kinase n=1 Tax=Acorus calamus TaxID=4465 RepID=A0AAV9E3P1_ACOCL|nr:LRR receptor-like serine/threonine-protein kinase FLS2 [Acorus calamus]